MSAKNNIAAVATVLTILAVPSVVSAQQGHANYGSFNSTGATSNRSQSQMNRFKAKVPPNAYGSPTPSPAQGGCPAGFSDRYGCTFTYNRARGERGLGNGPYWQGEPNDHDEIWRNNRYRGNDQDNFIRGQLMRDK
jgi:hypothetical protein